MDLKPIEGYENLYSFDFNTNQVYGHKRKKYLKPISKNGYYEIQLWKNSTKKRFQLHRLVYEIYKGHIPDNMEIDHIDNDKKNNNIDNLRLCTHSQNGMNCKTRKNNRLGYKNISKTKDNRYYRVLINKNKKRVYDKNFKTLEEAILNRDIKLVLIHGEFANLN